MEKLRNEWIFFIFHRIGQFTIFLSLTRSIAICLSFDDHIKISYVTIIRFLFLVFLRFSFISSLAECSIPASYNSFYSVSPQHLWSWPLFSKECSLWNILLYYLTFYHFLRLSISFVILPTISTYKPLSSFLSFPMLVYLVLLAPIDPLVISTRFWQVFALLLSRRFLSEPWNPWSISVWDCYVETPSTTTCTFAAERTLDPIRSILVLTQAECNILFQIQQFFFFNLK